MLVDRAHDLSRRVPFRSAHEGVLETELGNGWMVVEAFEIQAGRRVVAELKVCPAPPQVGAHPMRMWGERSEDDVVPAGGITARLLRTVKVGKYAAPVIADYREWIRKHFGSDGLKRLDAATARPSRNRHKRKARSHRAASLFYAELARDYVLLWEKGVKSPTGELARLRGVALEKVRSWVHLARANGLLTETSRGKAGGELTALARKILARDGSTGATA